jgi:Protein of unknown function (DUF1573)
MRPVKILIGGLLAVVGISVVVWSTRSVLGTTHQSAKETGAERHWREMKEGADRFAGRVAEDATSQPEDPGVERRPAVAAAGPFPKAVLVGDRVFAFGRMGTNEQRKHVFRIENKGPVPLVIAKGPTECKCTISQLSDHSVPPGKSAEVEIDWTPRDADPEFDKTAIVWTNDPALPEIHFEVIGKVAPPFNVAPRSWDAGIVTEDENGKAVGYVSSELDKTLKIVSIEPLDPNVKVEYRPLVKKELEGWKLQSGYEVTATVGKNMQLGRYRTRLKVRTSLSGKDPAEVEVTALRHGPVRFLSAVPLAGSAYWNAEKLLLNMGRFAHETGTKTALPALVYSMKDTFQLLNVKSSVGFVKVSVEPNRSPDKTASSGPQQVRFIFEVPPGSPPGDFLTGKPIRVSVQTNHPQLRDINFDLTFVSR